MGGRDDRPAVPRALDDGAGAPEPAGSGPGAAAQRPAARPTGLADALHGAPYLLAAVAAAPWFGDRPSLALRLVSKACCQAVDATPTRIRLDFDQARQQDPDPEARLARMERRLAKLPRLEELACSDPSDVELGQLLAGRAAAGVQRLEVRGCTSPQWPIYPSSRCVHAPGCRRVPPLCLVCALCVPCLVACGHRHAPLDPPPPCPPKPGTP
jgi:hypothetical protein